MDELERQKELFEQAMNELSENGLATADTFDKLNKSTSKYSKSLDKLDKFTDTYGRQIRQIGRDFDQNKGKMSAFSGITDLAGDALGELGVAGRLAGKALSAIAGMTFEEVDRTMENFQRMGSIGAVGADGMTEFRIGAHAATLTMDQFANIVTKNASALALATGNTLDGARALSQVTKAAGDTGLRRQLMNLGVGIEEQSEFFAEYFAQVRRLGLQQDRDFRSQTGAVGNYVKQLILLSRLTGESIDGARAQLEAQQRSARFEGAMQALAQQFGPEYANRIAAEVGALGNKLGPAGQSMLMDIFAGPNTQAAKDFLITFGAEGQAAIDRVKSGAADLGELSEMIVRSGMAQRERFGGPRQLALLAETGAIDQTVSALLSVPKATELTVESLQQLVTDINAGAAGADEMTRRLNEASESSQKTAVNLESTRDVFLNLGKHVLPGFSGAVEGATKMLKDLVHGLGGGIKPRAQGGPVTGGSPYLIGEEGPEIMVPKTSGTIISNDFLQKLQGADYHTIRDEVMRQQYILDTWEDRFTEFLKVKAAARLPGEQAFIRTAKFRQMSNTRDQMQANLVELMRMMTVAPITQSISAAEIPTVTRGRTTKNVMGRNITFDSTTRTTAEDTLYAHENYKKHAERLGLSSLQIPGFNKGGIATGPKSGYSAMLHGTEAVVPLPDGKNIPVETNASGGESKLVALMETMNATLQQVALNTRAGVDTSKKLLRAQS